MWCNVINVSIDLNNGSHHIAISVYVPICPPTFLDRNRWLLLPQAQEDEEEDQRDEDLKGQDPLDGKKTKRGEC